MKKGLFFLLLAGVLFADDSVVFKQKQEERLKDVNINLNKPQADINSVNISTLNQKKTDSENINIELNKNSANIDDIKQLINSDRFKNNIETTKKAILNDKQMPYGKIDLQVKETADKKILIDNQKVQSNPQYLDEPLIIFISSSMDKELIKNYFRAFKKANQDVTFVMNGLLPDTGTKIMPTINYIKDLLGKDYVYNVDIDPRKFEEYHIERVPAIAYKNYVHIGAVSPIHALENIYYKDTQNNQSLKKLLDNL